MLSGDIWRPSFHPPSISTLEIEYYLARASFDRLSRFVAASVVVQGRDLSMRWGAPAAATTVHDVDLFDVKSIAQWGWHHDGRRAMTVDPQ
jgi:hypothetical protein